MIDDEAIKKKFDELMRKRKEEQQRVRAEERAAKYTEVKEGLDGEEEKT